MQLFRMCHLERMLEPHGLLYYAVLHNFKYQHYTFMYKYRRLVCSYTSLKNLFEKTVKLYTP